MMKVSTGNKMTLIETMAKEDFEYKNILGRGVGGQVQQAIYKPLKKQVAIKSINVYDRNKRH